MKLWFVAYCRSMIALGMMVWMSMSFVVCVFVDMGGIGWMVLFDADEWGGVVMCGLDECGVFEVVGCLVLCAQLVLVAISKVVSHRWCIGLFFLGDGCFWGVRAGR